MRWRSEAPVALSLRCAWAVGVGRSGDATKQRGAGESWVTVDSVFCSVHWPGPTPLSWFGATSRSTSAAAVWLLAAALGLSRFTQTKKLATMAMTSTNAAAPIWIGRRCQRRRPVDEPERAGTASVAGSAGHAEVAARSTAPGAGVTGGATNDGVAAAGGGVTGVVTNDTEVLAVIGVGMPAGAGSASGAGSAARDEGRRDSQTVSSSSSSGRV